MTTENSICVPRAAVRGGLIVLAIAVVAGLVQQAPVLWRYLKIEAM